MGKMKEKKLKLEKKLSKTMPEFLDSVNGLSKNDLEKNIAIYAKYRADVEFARDNNEEIANLKEQLSNLTGPYADSIKVFKNKIDYLLLLLDDSEEN